MQRLSQPTKAEIVFNLFQEIGDEHTREEVMEEADITSEQSLRNILTKLRWSDKNPWGVGISIRIKDGVLTRES